MEGQSKARPSGADEVTKLCDLTAISPLDGRYWSRVQKLAHYFSEYALHKYRVKVEIEYFLALVELEEQIGLADTFGWAEEAKAKEKESLQQQLRSIYSQFSLADAERVKAIERVTNHDVKAIEYFIKEKFEALGRHKQKEWIHFALTSQDINNTAIPLSIKDGVEAIYLPNLKDKVLDPLERLAHLWMEVPMLARTHGQPATPTRVGRELMVFVERLKNQRRHFETYEYFAKFGGAIGGLNAHAVAYPNIDWIDFSNKFIASLGLRRLQYTTQIDHYDNLAQLFDTMRRINVILIDLCRDIWTYISLDYFKQKIVSTETGSSTMPHKVNPIDFENCEGNLGLANAAFDHLSNKLPISRLQRDLTDSTVLRNLGVPLGHTLVGFLSLSKGLDKLVLNEAKVHADLEENWAVVAEAIQTVLRREGVESPYELLKGLTRTGEKMTKEVMVRFIDELPEVRDEVKKELKAITPFNYIGVVPK
jgi:adenylosuccinate lyase